MGPSMGWDVYAARHIGADGPMGGVGWSHVWFGRKAGMQAMLGAVSLVCVYLPR